MINEVATAPSARFTWIIHRSRNRSPPMELSAGLRKIAMPCSPDRTPVTPNRQPRFPWLRGGWEPNSRRPAESSAACRQCGIAYIRVFAMWHCRQTKPRLLGRRGLGVTGGTARPATTSAAGAAGAAGAARRSNRPSEPRAAGSGERPVLRQVPPRESGGSRGVIPPDGTDPRGRWR